MQKHIFTFLLMGGLLALSACDSSDPANGIVGGEATVTVTGDIASSFSGQAFWSIFDEGTPDAMFGIIIIRGTLAGLDPDNMEFVGLGGGSTRLGVDSYALGFAGEQFGIYAEQSASSATGLFSETGVLEITTSTSSRVAGSATFSGTAFTADGPAGQASVQASFDAVYIDEDDLPDDVVIEFRR